ncbi:hypothetical protein [Actinomadura atramentaria]|uniref:hypothetical protein n=1 Tax=Actinomadura atramentaria TaxID=1990 RepID=UPI0003628F65|nr:hypothetical protein [Actinomadura atramentaria]
MSVTYLRPRVPPGRVGPVKHCPTCRTVLDGGPVLFRCASCNRSVRAADLPCEVALPGPDESGLAA